MVDSIHGIGLQNERFSEVAARLDEIDKALIGRAAEPNSNPIKEISESHEITRQAAWKRMRKLVMRGLVDKSGSTKNSRYVPRQLHLRHQVFSLAEQVDEDFVLQSVAQGWLQELTPNVRQILEYVGTEMINNAIDHSGGTKLDVWLHIDTARITAWVIDDGIGIFRKISQALNLVSEQQALIELGKGKCTTDPDRHSGEGIFFSSKAVDLYNIHSGGLDYVEGDKHAVLIEAPPGDKAHTESGTRVVFRLSQYSQLELSELFMQYAVDPEQISFDKTLVPVRLAQHGLENLVSRSQAKRLMARLEHFREVLLDFEGVPYVGQGFADEVFRVYRRKHPEVQLLPIKMNDAVQAMVLRALLHEHIVADDDEQPSLPMEAEQQ